MKQQDADKRVDKETSAFRYDSIKTAEGKRTFSFVYAKELSPRNCAKITYYFLQFLNTAIVCAVLPPVGVWFHAAAVLLPVWLASGRQIPPAFWQNGSGPERPSR